MAEVNSHRGLSSTLLLGVAAFTLFGALSPGANAQEGREDAEDNSRRLNPVVVTSTKRDTTLQDAPISIGVVDAETIAAYNITDLTDLQGFVPSLTVQKTFGNWSVRIRGLGSGVTNIAFDSSVSIFNDGIYCGRSQCLEAGFMDTGNIEVARGPQGALFGKSTVAGAISVVSARPTDTFEAYLRPGIELENGGYTVDGAISGPFSDTFRGRLALQFKDLDGDFSNPAIGRDEGGVESYAARGSVEWDITPTTSLFAKIETASTDTEGRRNQLVAAGALAGPNAPINRATLETNRDDVRFVSTGVSREDYEESAQEAFTAQLDQEIGDHMLTIVGGLWNTDGERFLDVDGVPEALLNTEITDAYEQQTIDIRLVSPSGNTFDYIVGALYHNSLTKTSQTSAFFPGFYRTAGVPAIVTATIPGATGVSRIFKRDSDTYSIYGQLTWNATDRLSIIGDLRYTNESQDALGVGLPVTFPDRENPVYTPNAPLQAASPEYRFSQIREDDSLDPSIRAMYELTDDINVYAAYSTGSKPGGLKANDGVLGNLLLQRDNAFQQRYVGRSNLTRADIAAGVTLQQGNGVFDFEGESAENFELGTKMVLANGAMNFNAAIFQMQFDNLQTSVYDGTQFIIGNAATAEVSGLELDGQWLATDNLKFSGSAAFLDATYGEYKNTQCPIGPNGVKEDAACVDGQGDLSGRRLERTPEVELNLSAAYNRDIANNLSLSAMVDMYYSSDLYVRQDFSPNGLQDSFTKWNARLAIGHPDDNWEFALIGRNLTDERTIQHAYQVLSSFVSLGQGRTITLEATKRW